MTRAQHLMRTNGGGIPFGLEERCVFLEERCEPSSDDARNIFVRAWVFPTLMLGYFAIIKRAAPQGPSDTTCDVWIVHAPESEVRGQTIRAAIAEFDAQAASFIRGEQ